MEARLSIGARVGVAAGFFTLSAAGLVGTAIEAQATLHDAYAVAEATGTERVALENQHTQDGALTLGCFLFSIGTSVAGAYSMRGVYDHIMRIPPAPSA